MSYSFINLLDRAAALSPDAWLSEKYLTLNTFLTSRQNTARPSLKKDTDCSQNGQLVYKSLEETVWFQILDNDAVIYGYSEDSYSGQWADLIHCGWVREICSAY